MSDRTCSVDDCEKEARYANGLCPMHRQRLRNHGTTDKRRPPKTPGPCSIEGCDGRAGIPGTARGWCGKHYRRWRKFGDPLATEPVAGWGEPCSTDACDKPAITRHLCEKHYMRWLTHGTTDLVAAWANAPDGEKWCSRCETYKAIAEFHKNRSKTDGLNLWCKVCTHEVGATYKANNPDKVAEWSARRSPEAAREATRRYRQKNPALGRSWGRSRRARIAGARSERFTRIEIAERDGWLCQICLNLGRRKSVARINRSLEWPDPKSLSMDHIIPLARGGDHTRANVQAAHLRCNLKKKCKGTDQLRLIG